MSNVELSQQLIKLVAAYTHSEQNISEWDEEEQDKMESKILQQTKKLPGGSGLLCKAFIDRWTHHLGYNEEREENFYPSIFKRDANESTIDQLIAYIFKNDKPSTERKLKFCQERAVSLLECLANKKNETKIADAFASYLNSHCEPIDKLNNSVNTEMLSFYVKRKLIKYIPVARRAVLLDMIMLDYYGDWSNILAEFGEEGNALLVSSDIDIKLAARTAVIREGRRQHNLRMFKINSPLGNTSDINISDYHPKCNFFYCDNLDGEVTKFSILCNVCNRAHWCSEGCRNMDPHSWCQPMPPVKKRVQVMVENECSSCGQQSSHHITLKACSRCKNEKILFKQMSGG
ncbi:hypothetical protein AKO1_012982 [Acrasis kona]|uniref:MYND-type domain-containing protein n=1 Tax=Acrasis kona TaxID=1008807 RepID=A0AAW2YZS6_9EUKA